MSQVSINISIIIIAVILGAFIIAVSVDIIRTALRAVQKDDDHV